MENSTVLHSERPHHDARKKSDYTGNFIFGISKQEKTWGSRNMKSVATSIPAQLHNFHLVFDFICCMFLKL